MVSVTTRLSEQAQAQLYIILEKRRAAVVLPMVVRGYSIYLLSSHGTDMDLAVGVLTPAAGVCRLSRDATVGRVTTGDKPS